MKKLLFWVLVFAGMLPAARALNWTSPMNVTVNSGQSYTVSASHTYSGGTVVGSGPLNIYKNGALFAGGGGGGTNFVANASNSTTDTGNVDVTYTATMVITPNGGGQVQTYSIAGTISVRIPNIAPTIQWVQNPASVQVNQWFAIQAKGHDDDGNLSNVFVWREWVPFAFDPGGNGYDNYSDANGYSQSTAGTVTFMAQAQDSTGATSPVIYHTVTITNNAPTISATSANIFVGGTATVNWSASDSDGNLNFVNAYVTRWGAPVWDDIGTGGATGSKSWSSSPNFTSTIAASGSYLFVARAWDYAGAFTDTYATFDIINRQPYNASITATVGGSNIVNNGYIWLGDQISLTGKLQDADGNLVHHGLYAQQTQQANPDPALWDPLTNNVPSNGADSTVTTNFVPNSLGRWDVHTDGDDGYINAVNGGASLTIYVYGTTNDAIFQSQSVPTSATTGDPFAVTITMANGGASNRPWINDSDPHKLVPANGGNWGVASVALPGGTTVFPPPQTPSTATFTFTAIAPTMPGTYQFQWQMSEQFPGNPALFGQKSTSVSITVADNDAPVAPVPSGFTATNLSPTSFTFNWGAYSDNSGAIALYEVSQNGVVVGTTTATSYNASGLAQATTYNMTVRAKDAANNWSPMSSAFPTKTSLDPAGDADGDGVNNGDEQALGLNPTDSSDTNVYNYEYDKVGRLKKGPGGTYIQDAEGNIKQVQP